MKTENINGRYSIISGNSDYYAFDEIFPDAEGIVEIKGIRLRPADSNVSELGIRSSNYGYIERIYLPPNSQQKDSLMVPVSIKPCRLYYDISNGSMYLFLNIFHEKYENVFSGETAKVAVGGSWCLSHALEVGDSYTDNSGDEIVKSIIDLGQVYDIEYLSLILQASITAKAQGSHITVYTSLNNESAAYQPIFQSGSLNTITQEYRVKARNIKCRYLIFAMSSGVATSTATMWVFPSFVWIKKKAVRREWMKAME